MKVGHRAPPGDDVVPVPPPVREQPPGTRQCDLVMTGGVASGVVYPWAIVELARHYHFRQIGGSSVGAMAAALAAAAEYGRRCGHRDAFEPLRRAPEQLGETLPEGGTRMLSLFQPNVPGQRLLQLFLAALPSTRGGAEAQPPPLPPPATATATETATAHATGTGAAKAPPPRTLRQRLLHAVWQCYGPVLRHAAIDGAGTAVMAAAVLTAWDTRLSPGQTVGAAVAGVLATALWAAWGLLQALRHDLEQGLIEHDYGLCHGAAVGADADPERERLRDRPGLTDWLHDGIQRSAGLLPQDPPLTFADLWRAPLLPGSAERGGDAPGQRAIDLRMLTSSLSHMRPYALPHLDGSSRLFFSPREWQPYLPPPVWRWLVAHARPYQRRHAGEPDPAQAVSVGAGGPPEPLLELPGADLPLVVAARLSLSYPLLFAAVPLYAIDYAQPGPQARNASARAQAEPRGFTRTWFSDGGLCSNFPIHLFDAALPRRPTFGLWLDQRDIYYPDEAVWLPRALVDGMGDSWSRFDAHDRSFRLQGRVPGPWARLGRAALALLSTTKDWGDRMAMRMPHTRHRVARLFLRSGEGQLNIAMPRATILAMAHHYGTQAGLAFVERWVGAPGQPPRFDWQRQRWLRLRSLLPALQRQLRGLALSAQGDALTGGVGELLQQAQATSLTDEGGVPSLDAPQAQAWHDAVQALQRLEQALDGNPLAGTPDAVPGPEPELRLRPPV